MPENNVKSLLDDIISKTNTSFNKTNSATVGDKESVGVTVTHNNFHPQTFDSGKFREKLSLYVLHDLIDAMMHDETQDLNEMIDTSIIKHIKDNYNGTCYGYLCNARDRLKSPLIGDIVQEVEDKTSDTENALDDTKDSDLLNGDIDVHTLLKDVKDYDTFRDKLKKQVSNKVVKDVAQVITKRNDAPVFDDLDEKLNKKDADEVKKDMSNDETAQESVIVKMCGAIVTECAIAHTPISTEEGMNRAIVEYCLNEMDYLFKQVPKKTMYMKYNI